MQTWCRSSSRKRSHHGSYQVRHPSIRLQLRSHISLRNLHLRPWVWRPETSPVPKVLFDLLFSLRNLLKLHIGLQLEHLTPVKKEFNVVDDVLPRVDAIILITLESLTIPSPEWMFLAECAPNLTSLDVVSSRHGHWSTYVKLDIDMVRLGKSHPNLTRLHCRETGMASHIQGQSHLSLNTSSLIRLFRNRIKSAEDTRSRTLWPFPE